MKAKTFEVKVKSISPLLFNTRQRELDIELKNLKKDQLEEWEQKNWKRKAETDKNGNIYIPSRWFRGCFINACKFTRIVPHFATSKNQTYTKYAESMFFKDGSFKCKKSDLKEYGAYVGAQGANSKTKIWRIRPLVEEWETTFEVIDTGERMLLEEFKMLMESAGMIIGIGDGKAIGFGRFEVISINEK